MSFKRPGGGWKSSMKLKKKLLVLYVISIALTLLIVGYHIAVRLDKEKFLTIEKELDRQLMHLDFALTNAVKAAEADVEALALNELIRTRDDSGFTSFVDIDVDSFEYNIPPDQQKIVNILNAYRETHPYVNSVYMGRENGTFVRSHPTERIIEYDPRVRPWYILGKENPGKVMRTSPYSSITQPDINIGVVTALVDEKGKVYGVVGADITLENLTDYIQDIKVGRNGWAALVDKNGMILASGDKSALSTNVLDLGQSLEDILKTKKGYTTFTEEGHKRYVFFYTSAYLGWKLCLVMPSEEINREISSFVGEILLDLALVLIVLSIITFIGLQRFVIRPVKKLDEGVRQIEETGKLDVHIDVKSKDELGDLAEGFNSMEGELKKHRNHLEELVEERTDELAKANEKLEELSITDPLTGVFNRRYLMSRLNEEIKRAQRNKHSLSLITADLDHFKEINDTAGHSMGDEVLKQMADVFRKVVRETDIIARYGGDEFFVILPDTSREGASILAGKIVKKINEGVFEKGEVSLKYTISLGISTLDGAAIEQTVLSDEFISSAREDFMKKADKALYEAKEEGRNTFRTEN